MVSLFDQIGVGQWFRYLTGAIEVISGIALLIPSVAMFGALMIVSTILGAIATSVLVTHASPALPILLLMAAVAVAWLRRHQLRVL